MLLIYLGLKLNFHWAPVRAFSSCVLAENGLSSTVFSVFKKRKYIECMITEDRNTLKLFESRHLVSLLPIFDLKIV